MMESIQYQVIQYQVVKAGKGFCIAAFDESSGSYSRLSQEEYLHFEDACVALFGGDWTLGGSGSLAQNDSIPLPKHFRPDCWPANRGGQACLDEFHPIHRSAAQF